MFQTKFFVFRNKLWNYFKFGVIKPDEGVDWTTLSNNFRYWLKLRFKKLPPTLSDIKTHSDVKHQSLLQNSYSQKLFCKFHHKREFVIQKDILSRRNQNRYRVASPNEIKKTQSCFLGVTLPKEFTHTKIPINYETRQEYRTYSLDDGTSNKLVKKSPIRHKSSLIMCEAGNCSSKSKVCNCESKRKSKYKNSTNSRKSSLCDPKECERHAKISASHLIKKCKRVALACPERKEKCVEEVKAVAPPQEDEEPYSSESSRKRSTEPWFNQMSSKMKKKICACDGSKNGSSKECTSARSGSLCCSSPNKRNSLSNLLSRSRSPSKTSSSAQKCPLISLRQATCSKESKPSKNVTPLCSPSSASLNLPRSSSCPTTCLPSPPPPPCSPPAPTPKMEALQFDPVCKKLNFYMLNAPTCIRKDEVLVQIVYSGVCGTDFSIMEGKFGKLCKPVIMGHEFSGIACVVGSGVSHVKSGDCVAINPYTSCQVCKYCVRGQFGACICQGLKNTLGIHKDGGWTEFIVVNKTQVHQIPQCLNLGQAVLIQPLSCIVNAMSKLDVPFGSDIVIQGTGVTGCLWASLLHMQGHRNVIACDISEYKRKIFQCLDLKFCIEPPEKLCDVKADIVIDCTGSGNSIERGVKMLNSQGQLLIFGMPPPDEEISIQPNIVAQKELKILSVITNTNSFAKALTLAKMMGCRYLDFEKLGIQTFRLGQYEGAFNMKKCGEISKIVFQIQSSQ